MQEVQTRIPELVLGEFKDSDLETLVEYMNDPVVYQNTLTIPHPYSEQDGLNYLEHVKTFERLNGKRKDWAIRYHDELIGSIGLLYNHGLESHRSEIGYWLAKPHRGKGLMSICVHAFSRYILNSLPITRVEAHVFAHNPTSSRVLEKSGFTREGYIRGGFMKDGVALDAYFYSLLRDDL